MKNVASGEAEFEAQKSEMQEEAQMGETAASISAKVPLSPETVIKGVQEGMWLSESDHRIAVFQLALTSAIFPLQRRWSPNTLWRSS